jgi:methanethiol oxidase
VDVDPLSTGYGHLVGQVDMPNAGDELHHFG